MWTGAFDHLEHVAGADRDPAELVREHASEEAEVDGLGFHVQTAGVDPREVEEIGSELGQAVDLLPHRLEKLTLRLLVELLVLQQFEEAAQREDRRPQLMRRVRDELPARPLEPREPFAHPFEGARQLADLVRSLVGDGLAEVAARDALGCAFEPAQAPCEHRGRAVADRNRRQQRDHAGDQEPPTDLVDVCKRVVEGGAQEQHVSTSERLRGLGKALFPPLDRPRRGPTRPGRFQHDRVTGQIGRRDAVRVRKRDQGVLVELAEVADTRVGARSGVLQGQVEVGRVCLLHLAPDRGQRLAELLHLGMHEVALERGDDDHVDEPERGRDDDRQREAEPRTDASERVHPAFPRRPARCARGGDSGGARLIGRGSGSRRRAR